MTTTITKYDFDPTFRQLFEDCAAEMSDRISYILKMPYGQHQAECYLMPHFLGYWKANLKKRFELLKQEWEQDTCFTSNANEIVSHPAYLKIIAMGKDALPLIFNCLRQEHNFWYHALVEITGENPMVDEEAGNLPCMTKRWLDWADNNGYPAKDFEVFTVYLAEVENEICFFDFEDFQRKNRIQANKTDIPQDVLRMAEKNYLLKVKIKYESPENYILKDWKYA